MKNVYGGYNIVIKIKKKLDALIMNFDDDNIWMNAWNKNLLWYAIYSLYCDLSVMKLFQPIIQREVDKDK